MNTSEKSFKCESCRREYNFDEYRYSEDENKCILHCNKDNWFVVNNKKKDWSKSVDKVNLFWKLIDEKINSVNNNASILENATNTYLKRKRVDTYGCVCKRVVFPRSDFFNPMVDEKLLSFNDIINSSIIFKECIFLDTISFNSISEVKKVFFLKCKFFEDVFFDSQILLNEFQFINCEVKGKAHFNNIIFKNYVNFNKTKFHKVSFQKSFFYKECLFTNVNFISTTNFKYAQFYKKVIFRDAIIKEKLDLRKTIFYSDANFLDITLKERKRKSNGEYIGEPKDINVANRETARIIKAFYDNSNNTIEANRFYKLEMKEKAKELKFFKNPFEWFVFKSHWISSNHSQNWVLALFWILFLPFMYIFFGVVDKGTSSIIYNLGTKSILDEIANLINPFSIMIKGEVLTFSMLGFKVVIAYLIYQFIVSIRQNTRRK